MIQKMIRFILYFQVSIFSFFIVHYTCKTSHWAAAFRCFHEIPNHFQQFYW